MNKVAACVLEIVGGDTDEVPTVPLELAAIAPVILAEGIAVTVELMSVQEGEVTFEVEL